MQKLEFLVRSFKRMEEPFDHHNDIVKYRFYTSIQDVPEELESWMTTNPRGQKLTTEVSKAIIDSLHESKEMFHLLNRGILISAKSVTFDNKTNLATITLEDPSIHGNIDGGHTFKLILQERESLKDDSVQPYVEFEVVTGFKDTVQLAEARNTSVQVQQKAIAELNQLFEPLKDILKSDLFTVSFMNRIEWYQNQFVGEKIDFIDGREIIAIINMFNRVFYPIDNKGLNHPIQSYTGKEVSLNKYLKLAENGDFKELLNMSPIIPDIFKIWEEIEITLPNIVNKNNRRYGSRDYSRRKEIIHPDKPKDYYSLFGQSKLEYVVPRGLMYPLMGCFRGLVKVDQTTGKYSWKITPQAFWRENSSVLASALMQASEDKSDNPNAIGKFIQLWDNLLQKTILISSINLDNV